MGEDTKRERVPLRRKGMGRFGRGGGGIWLSHSKDGVEK